VCGGGGGGSYSFSSHVINNYIMAFCCGKRGDMVGPNHGG
jgi:hypothetical protein